MGKSKSRQVRTLKSKLQWVGLAALALACAFVVAFALVEKPQPTEVKTVASAPVETSTPFVQVGVIGDSYTGGTALGGLRLKNWTKVAQANLHAQGVEINLTVNGAGGSGYAAPGTAKTTFPQVVSKVAGPRTGLVVVLGSRNDMRSSPETVRAASAETYASIKQLAPDAKLLVVGPVWTSENVPENISALRDSVKASADAAGATFVDPLNEGWFFGENAALIGEDKVHPTDEGHAYMAKLIEPHIKASLGR